MNDLIVQTAEAREADFARTWRIAEIMSQGVATMPKHLQGNPADCFAVAIQAEQWGMIPFAVAQKTHLVNGVLGYEAQLVNAVISSSKVITGRFKYEYSGEWKSAEDRTASIRCGAIIRGEDEITWGEWLYPANVTTKNSPLWKTAPKQQASYLAVKYWARMYTPDVILGVYSPEEFDEQPEKDITPPKNAKDFINSTEVIDRETGEINVPNRQDDAQQQIDLAIKQIHECETLKDIQILELELKRELSNLDDAQRSPIRVELRNKKSNMEFLEG